jgi:hypothetical protein
MPQYIPGFKTLFDDLIAYRKFKGKNPVKSSRKLYEARKRYNSFAYYELNLKSHAHTLQRPNSDLPKPITNFQDIRKIYYGKIDYLGNPVVLRQNVDKEGTRVSAAHMSKYANIIKYFTPPKSFGPVFESRPDYPVQAVGFVSRAFSEFVSDYENACNCNEIKSKNKFLSKIVAYKGYESPHAKHQKHQRAIYRGFIEYVNRTLNFNSIKNFDEFMGLFLNYIKLLGPIARITRDGFMKSYEADPFTSGLTISISNLNCGHDQSKIDSFIDDPSFLLYMKKAVKHGFTIDRNVPWRLVANLASVPMRDYMAGYGFPNLEIFFDTSYNYAYKDDFLRVKKFMIESHNSFVRANSHYNEEPTMCNGRPNITRKKRAYISEDEVNNKYPTSYWLKLYALIRNNETANPISDVDMDSLIKDIDLLSMIKDCGYIESYIDEKIGKVDTVNEFMERIHNISMVQKHLEEDKLPANLYNKQRAVDFAESMKKRISKNDFENRGDRRVKQLRSIEFAKYGAIPVSAKVTSDNKISLRTLAGKFYYTGDRSVGDDFTGPSTEWYNGAGDSEPNAGIPGPISDNIDRDSNLKAENLSSHMYKLRQRKSTGNTLQEDTSEQDTNTNKSCQTSFGNTPPLLGARSAFSSNVAAGDSGNSGGSSGGGGGGY